VKLVIGENVSQAFQFAYTGNAEFGFVALSQAIALGQSDSSWRIPLDYYRPINQEMVLLSNKAGARALFSFLQSAAMTPILQQHGYGLPQR
jgi:molybdate transport system substrate-binding protein